MLFTVKHFEQIKTQTRTKNEKRQSRVSETAIKKNFVKCLWCFLIFHRTHTIWTVCEPIERKIKQNKTKREKGIE